MYVMVMLIDFDVYFEWSDLICVKGVPSLGRVLFVSRMTSFCGCCDDFCV